MSSPSPYSNLKSKLAIWKVFKTRRQSKQSRKEDEDYCYLNDDSDDFTRFLDYILGLLTNSRSSDDGSAKSIISFSTTSTADNLPGTGRLIDMYIYQRFGKKIERLALRHNVSSLPAFTIANFLDEGMANDFTFHRFGAPLLDIMSYLSKEKIGSAYLAGLRSLVKRAQ